MINLAQQIVTQAQQKSITFTFAESCSGGLCASTITDISGSSEVFKGSIVSYSNEIKHKVIGVSAETLERFGAVAQETAQEMAQGALETFGANIAISLTGVAGPLGGTKQDPVGTVWIGIANNKGRNFATKYIFGNDRLENKEQFSQQALTRLLEEIKNY